MAENRTGASKSRARRVRPQAILTVGLDEFAQLCGVSPRTMQQHLKSAPRDAAWFVQRGSRGRGHRIEPGGGVDWYQEHRRPAEPPRSPEDDARLQAMRRELLGDAFSEEASGLSARERYEEIRAADAEVMLRQRMGDLAPVNEMMDVIFNAMIRFRQGLIASGPTMQRRFNLQREAVEWLYDEHRARLQECITLIEAGLPVPAPAGQID